MSEQYVTKDDLEDFKRTLVAKLKIAEVELKEKNSGNMLLRSVYHKWIYNTYAKDRFDTPFIDMFGCDKAYRIWDGVRKVVCGVIGVNSIAQIHHSKKDFAVDFIDKLCEFIFEYVKQNKEGVQNG